jgi:hypothetical protein
MFWTAYVMADPRSPENVRYVGKTNSKLYTRLSGHLNYARKPSNRSHLACWIRSLLAEGLRPCIRAVEQGDGDWQAAERKWIAWYRSQGSNLCNATDGGDGTSGHHKTPEQVARTVEAVKLVWKKKLADGWKPTPSSPEGRARTIAATKGKPRSEEVKAKIGAANRGRVMSPEARAKMSAAKKGKPPHNKGKPGVKPSAETREKLSISHKAAWARRKLLTPQESTKDFVQRVA